MRSYGTTPLAEGISTIAGLTRILRAVEWRGEKLVFVGAGLALQRIYDRLLFGRRGPLVGKISKIVHAWEQRMRMGDIPITKDAWDSQYQRGRWDYMRQLGEVARYSTVVGYCSYFKPGGSILDVGCGEGILRQQLGLYGVFKYTGVDFSDVAIRKASELTDYRTSFVQANAEAYIPDEQFDVVVFNEVLYYFEDPLRLMQRYLQYLKQNGIIIVSTFPTVRSTGVLRRLKATYQQVDEVWTTHGASKNGPSVQQSAQNPA